MAFEDEAIPIIRAMISDDGTVAKYTDDQILNLITTAAYIVKMDGASIGFLNTYVISVQDQTIKPDPTVDPTKDDDFFTLTMAKAACMLALGAGYKAAGQALRIKSRDDELDLKDGYKARLAVSAAACDQYKALMNTYIRNARMQGVTGRVIVTPIRTY